MIKKIILIAFVLSALVSNAQNKILIESQDKIIEQAKHELDSAMSAPNGKIFLFGQKNNLKGSYIFDLTIREKGEVAVVFVVSNENGNITSQNILKDFIQDFEFYFKMPKGKRYKFQYEFKFS